MGSVNGDRQETHTLMRPFRKEKDITFEAVFGGVFKISIELLLLGWVANLSQTCHVLDGGIMVSTTATTEGE